MLKKLLIPGILFLLFSCQTITRSKVDFYEEPLHTSEDSIVYFYRSNTLLNSAVLVEITIIGENSRFVSKLSMEGYLPIHLEPGEYLIEFHSLLTYSGNHYNKTNRLAKITLNLAANRYRYIKIDGFSVFEVKESLALEEIKETRYEVYDWEELPIEEWRKEWRADWKNNTGTN